ncbi:MAG: hypothetical protein ABR583_01425 [Gaiellaceae bacterium]
MDLSRKRLDFCLLDESGERVEVGAAPPDADGLRSLARRLARHEQPLRAAIESMTAPASSMISSSWPAGRSRSPTR